VAAEGTAGTFPGTTEKAILNTIKKGIKFLMRHNTHNTTHAAFSSRIGL
jgi:hypothetical protein